MTAWAPTSPTPSTGATSTAALRRCLCRPTSGNRPTRGRPGRWARTRSTRARSAAPAASRSGSTASGSTPTYLRAGPPTPPRSSSSTTISTVPATSGSTSPPTAARPSGLPRTSCWTSTPWGRRVDRRPCSTPPAAPSRRGSRSSRADPTRAGSTPPGWPPTPAASSPGATSPRQAFHNLIVAWSDDGGASWIPEVAYDAGNFHDASSPFAAFTLDNQGNPYIGFVNNLNWTPACSVPVNTTPDSSCEYDTYVVWSPDAGASWKGPFKVNSSTGTHCFPPIAAGDPGKVDLAWLETSTVVPTGPNGKDWPGMCFPTVSCTNTNQWFLWAGQSLDLGNASPTWARTRITATPIHVGGICNLGIACPPNFSNRNLADFIMETVDPQGCAHIAYADDQTTHEVDSAA